MAVCLEVCRENFARFSVAASKSLLVWSANLNGPSLKKGSNSLATFQVTAQLGNWFWVVLSITFLVFNVNRELLGGVMLKEEGWMTMDHYEC